MCVCVLCRCVICVCYAGQIGGNTSSSLVTPSAQVSWLPILYLSSSTFYFSSLFILILYFSSSRGKWTKLKLPPHHFYSLWYFPGFHLVTCVLCRGHLQGTLGCTTGEHSQLLLISFSSSPTSLPLCVMQGEPLCVMCCEPLCVMGYMLTPPDYFCFFPLSPALILGPTLPWQNDWHK